MPFSIDFRNELKEKVKTKMVYDSIKQRKEKNKKNSADKLAWKAIQKKYEEEKEFAAKSIADNKFKLFKEWNVKLYKMNSESAPEEDKAKAEQEYQERMENNAQSVLEVNSPVISKFIDDALKYKPKYGKKLSLDGEKSDILAVAEEKYQEQVDAIMAVAKLAVKQQKKMEQAAFDKDSINRNLAQIPFKLEDKLKEVKTTLELLMGKQISPAVDPDSHEFDPEAVVGSMKTAIAPLMSLTSPLVPLVGKVPVLGDLMKISQTLAAAGQGNASGLSKKELAEMFPKMPDIPTKWLMTAGQTLLTIMEFMLTVPLILINSTFAMVNVVYSKLKIVSSVVPLGNLYPLSLVPAICKGLPQTQTFFKLFGSMMWDLLVGVMKKQVMEMLALGIPKDAQIPEETKALIANLKYQKAAKARKRRERRTYKNVTSKVFESRLKEYGYLKQQAETIQKNYKAIFNGNPEMEITVFEDSGKDQYLPPLKNRVADFLMLGLNRFAIDPNKKEEPGFTETKLKRKFPSVDDYEAYFNGLIDGNPDKLSDSLVYDNIYSVESLVGEYYKPYRDQLVKKYGEQVVLRDRMTPKNMTWGDKPLW